MYEEIIYDVSGPVATIRMNRPNQLNVSEEFVAQCPTPLLVLMGKDIYHPEETSREIAKLAPHATLIEQWMEPEYIASAQESVEQFLAEHTPQ